MNKFINKILKESLYDDNISDERDIYDYPRQTFDVKLNGEEYTVEYYLHSRKKDSRRMLDIKFVEAEIHSVINVRTGKQVDGGEEPYLENHDFQKFAEKHGKDVIEGINDDIYGL